MVNKLTQIGKLFRLPGLFFSYEELTRGNVNSTYKVNYVRDDGTGKAEIKSYLFQTINTYAFHKPGELMENIERVTDFLRQKGLNTLHFHHTRDRANYVSVDGEIWRVYTYIDAVTFDTTDDLMVVRNAGSAFGQFQSALVDFDASKLHSTIPDFHNTVKRYDQFRQAIAKDECGRLEEVRKEVEWLLGAEGQACILEKSGLPLRVTHNDTKINNVLFDEHTHDALMVIDLDTVMPGYIGHDFGDGVRFAANFTQEDSENLTRTGLDLNVFWAFADGFLSRTAGVLTKAEADTLGMSVFALACELATRFLADYLNGDKYFKCKKDQHNLIRARCQIALAKDILKKLDAMNAIVNACMGKYAPQANKDSD